MISLYRCFLLLATAGIAQAATSTTLIPTNCFNSYRDLETWFDYGYPWGSDHNGGARMVGSPTDHSHVSINTPGTLTLTATPVRGQPPSTHNTHPAIHYFSGTVHSRSNFLVNAANPGLDFRAKMKATTTRGTWPAFWLTGANSWPPELDLAEWKGNGKVSFNTFNTSSRVTSTSVNYPNPDEFHLFLAEVRKINTRDVSVKYYMDGNLLATHYGAGYVGQPMNLILDLQMEGASGSPGPTGTTQFQIRDFRVLQVSG